MAGLVTLMCGPAGAGKTTHARELERRGAVRLSFDEEHWALGYRTDHPPREVIARVERELWDRTLAAAAERDVVLDYSFSVRSMREDYRARLHQHGLETRLVLVTASAEELHRRVAERVPGADPNRVWLSVADLRDYLDGFEYPGPDERPLVVRTDRTDGTD